MSLKDLTYKVKYEINDKDLKEADKALDKGEKSAQDLADELKRGGNEAKGLGKETKTIAEGFSTLGALLASKAISYGIGLIGSGIRAAKDLTFDLLDVASAGQESIAKFEIVFGDLSESTFEWIDVISEKIGRGKGDLRGYLADTQAILFGYTDQSDEMRKVSAEMSKDVTRLALDLAAMNDVADADALHNLVSGLLGTHQAVRSLSIPLTEATLKEEMFNQGIKGNFNDLDELTKIQIRYATAVRYSQTSLGHAERESADYASQVKLLQGTIKDIKEEIGVELLPVAIEFIEIIRENKDVIIELGKKFVEFVGTQGKDLADFFKDKERMEEFKDTVLRIADAVVILANGVVEVGKAIGFVAEQYQKVKEFEGKLGKWVFGESDSAFVNKAKKIGRGAIEGASPGVGRALDVWEYKSTKGFAKGTDNTPDTFIAGEEGPELITGAAGRTVFTNEETKNIFNKNNSGGIAIKVPININGTQQDTSSEMRDEIEDFFGELLVKYGYVEVV